jgi:hypothetical protein
MMVCALSVAGCNHLGSTMTEEQFCQEYAKIECSKVSAFCSFNPATCEPVRVAACRESAGRVKGVGHQFNPGNTDRCLKKLEEAYRVLPIGATMLKGVDDACARVFEGTAKPAEMCTLDYDCANGLICDKGRCGTEKLVASLGGCANIGERCPKGEYCTNATGIFLCAKRLAEGAPCALSTPCAEDLRCRNTCVRRLEIQGSCLLDEDCLSGYCNLYVSNRTCGLGLTFSPESPSCIAYMSSPDGGVPGRGTNEVTDGSVDLVGSSPDAGGN